MDLIDFLRTHYDIHLARPDLITLALTHASKHSTKNNERLEFLGDRVLSLVLAERLYAAFPDESEGNLALRHAALAKMEMLATQARGLNLSAHLIVSEADRHGDTAQLDNVLADALEALIGAVYLDAGLSACQKFIAALWDNTIQTMGPPPRDPKTALQEWAQGQGYPLPIYDITHRSGPDHAPVFTIQVSVKTLGTAEASGLSRKIAEKQAALALLQKIPGMNTP